ncbi:60S ribosomal protein L28 [Thelohanellus kitauei]|uniref:Large ribosomal subunit protein eL28 n=1 Tax=Thelohanellus kitauei TaxID=669202 RepID=A0A0C2NF10_THEKT|nr:60S ribosomal protein L28 [Thelohanellus kitauei]
MPLDLEWELIKKNNCFLVKNNGLVLTKEPFNLMRRHKRKYCGLVQKKPDRNVDSLVLTVKHGDKKAVKKMFTSHHLTKCKKGIRPTLRKTGRIVRNLWISPWATKTSLKVASNLIKDHSKQTRNRSRKLEGKATYTVTQ